MKKILVLCGKDGHSEKINRLMKELNGFDFLLFNDEKLFLNSITEKRYDAILIHKTDFRRIISENNYEIIDAVSQIILVGDDSNENSIHQSNIHWLSGDFTNVELLNQLPKKETDYKQIQGHQNIEHQYLRMLMEHIPDRIYFKDKNSRFILANKSIAKIFGKDTPEELYGKSDFDFHDPEHAKQAFDDEQKLMNSGIPLVNQVESHFINGTHVWEISTKIPLFNKDNEVMGMVGISRDFTRQKQLEDSLEKEKDLMQILMDNVPDLIFFKDLDSKYIRTNRATEKLSGVKESGGLVGKCDYDIYPKKMADVFYRDEQNIFSTGKALINKTERSSLLDGTPIWMSTTKMPVKDKNGKITGLVGISRDISIQELTKQQFFIAKEKAEDANKAKSMFLANMSHEIRTPMNGIIGMSDILNHTELDTVQRDYLDIIMKSGQTLMSLINDILDFSKIESGKMTMESAPINIRNIIEEVADIHIVHAKSKSVDLLTYVDVRMPEFVTGDYVRVKQVITNLVNNAIKFTSKGEVLVSAEYLSLNDKKHEVLIKVKDSGIGIAKEDQQKLFKSFSQVDASTTRKFGGTGLGLAISQSLVHEMGGQINLDSEEGNGSVFSFIAKFGVEQKELDILSENGSFNKLNILIVDDNHTNRKIFREYMEGWGANVYEATNGKEAFLKLIQLNDNNNSVDIVLIDYHMDGIDGLELAKRINTVKLLQSSHLVLLTSVTEAIQRSDLKKYGFEHYLNKPIKLIQLFNLIASIIGKLDIVKTNLNEQKFDLNENDLNEKRFLIVEDNEINMKFVQILLGKITSSIFCARNGQEAVEIFKNEKIDFVLMDVQMPVMNGIDATIQIRDIEKRQRTSSPAKIIAMTANTMHEDAEKCLNSGMDAFLEKPFKVDDLVHVLRDIK